MKKHALGRVLPGSPEIDSIAPVDWSRPAGVEVAKRIMPQASGLCWAETSVPRID